METLSSGESPLPNKTEFFDHIAQSAPLSAWRMHKESGHFNTEKSARFKRYRKEIEEQYSADAPAKPGRQGVLEHVLVVAARTDELAQLLQMSDDMRQKLRAASILHDAGKYEERLMMLQAQQEGTSQWDAYDFAATRSWVNMRDTGLDEDIVEIAGAAGHATIPDAKFYMDELDHLTEKQLAWLALHYVDDFTRGSESVAPASLNTETGSPENDLDRRMEMNRKNPAYDALNQEGLKREGFHQLTFDVQQTVGHRVEQLLLNEIVSRYTLHSAIESVLRDGESIDDLMGPVHLPEIIDRLVQSRYQQTGA